MFYFTSKYPNTLSEIRNQKWFNKDATDVHQPITVIEHEMTLLYSKKNKNKTKIYQFTYQSKYDQSTSLKYLNKQLLTKENLDILLAQRGSTNGCPLSRNLWLYWVRGGRIWYKQCCDWSWLTFLDRYVLGLPQHQAITAVCYVHVVNLTCFTKDVFFTFFFYSFDRFTDYTLGYFC